MEHLVTATNLMTVVAYSNPRKPVKMELLVDQVIASNLDGTDAVEHPQADIGPQTIKNFNMIIAQAKTVLWNGPMGIFEKEPFAKGTMAVAAAVAEATGRGAFTVVGGGDSVAALSKSGLTGKISHVSTGGALLEFLGGQTLPGVEALTKAPKKA
jgi:phosphoglycerate kinase